MNLSFRRIGDFRIVALAGVVDSASAGQLLDALVAAFQEASGDTLIVDLRDVTNMTRAGVRGFVVAAKLARNRGDALHITGASPSVEGVLENLGYTHLFRFDRGNGKRPALSQRAA